MHRLTLTGYLNAMADLGILREREIKPSKIYSIDTSGNKDVYSVVGSIVKIFSEDNMSDYALLLLHSIFGRPIFVKEMERCNVGLPRNYRKVVPEKRKEYIDQLATGGLSVPTSNSMIEPTLKDNGLVSHLMRLVISYAFDLKGELTNRNNGVQKTLD